MENNNEEIKNLNYYKNDLELLADIAVKKQILLNSKSNEVKKNIFFRNEKLKEYAIYYRKNIKNWEINAINAIDLHNKPSTNGYQPKSPQM